MEREKMIETILHNMCPFFSDGMCRGEIRCDDDCIKRIFAKDAVDEILPEGSVVLTAEERDEEMREYNRDRAEIEEQARNEKAKEILQSLYDRCYERQKASGGKVCDVTPIIILQFAKDNGVEVE